MLPPSPLRRRRGAEPTPICRPLKERPIDTVLSLFGIIPNKLGSQEAFARELSLQLAEHGWRSVLCFEDVPSEVVGRELDLPNVSLEVLPDPARIRWSTIKTYLAILRRYRPEIVHVHYVGFLGPYPLLARLCGAKRVYFTDHASQPAYHVSRRAPLWKRVLTRLVNYPLSAVICVSAYGKSCRSALDLLPADRIHMIYNGVDTDRGAPSPERGAEFRRKHGIPEDCPVVTQVSWLIPEKGIEDLLQAWRVVLKETSNAHLVVVGDGESRDEYVRLASQLGVEDHVTWTGLIQDPLDEGVYACADVVCQVSRWEEVFGFTIAEAMAGGKPVVATRVGGIPELVSDGVTGFLVPRADVAGIADRIVALLADADMRERFGLAGRKIARARFDLKKNVGEFLALYGLHAAQG